MFYYITTLMIFIRFAYLYLSPSPNPNVDILKWGYKLILKFV